MRRLLTVGLLALVLCMLSSSKAIAADVPDPAVAQARKLFRDGMARYNLNQFKEALDRFQAAYLAEPDPVFLFNIGQCFRNLSDYGNAAKFYRNYLREAPTATNREEVQRLIASMDQAAEESRARQPPTGMETPSSAQSPSAVPANTPSSAVATPPYQAGAAKATRPGRVKVIAGLATAGAGVAMAALGGGFAALAQSAHDDAYRGGMFDPSAYAAHGTYQSVEIALLAVGGAAVIAGVTVAALGFAERKRGAAVAVVPVLSPGVVGGMLELGF